MRKVQRNIIIAALLASVFPGSAQRAVTAQHSRTDATSAHAGHPRDMRPLLVCFGDSLTAGYGAEPGHSYPDYLQKDLDQLHLRYRVVNEGVSGNTTKDGVNRLNEVLALRPALVVVEFGGNDGLRGLPLAQTRANLDHIVGALMQAGAQVAIAGITLPPQYGTDYVDQFNQIYQTLAKKYRVPMLPFLLQNAYGGPGMIQADGIHPTAKGNEVVARNVLNLLRPILKR